MKEPNIASCSVSLKGQLYIFFFLLNEILTDQDEPYSSYGFTDSNEDMN